MSNTIGCMSLTAFTLFPVELFQCELYHWADVLDLFDSVLEKGCAHQSNKSWTMACDLLGNGQVKIL